MSTPPTPDAEEIRHALRQVMDPEVGMNIVDLGLIYRIDCAPGELYIELTMTTPSTGRLWKTVSATSEVPGGMSTSR